MRLMEFDWDEEKRKINLDKHGVDFFDAYKIFFGTVLQKTDNRREYGEVRINAIGKLGSEILFVTYSRRGEVHRIISARKANKNEREAYQQYC